MFFSHNKSAGTVFRLVFSATNGAKSASIFPLYVFVERRLRMEIIRNTHTSSVHHMTSLLVYTYVIPRCLHVAVLLLKDSETSLSSLLTKLTEKQGCCNRSLVRYQHVRRLAHGNRAKGAKTQ